MVWHPFMSVILPILLTEQVMVRSPTLASGLPPRLRRLGPKAAWTALIGLALLLGIFVRPAAIAGAIMLFLYYIAAPPLPGLTYAIPAEGSYLIVNKILVELGAMLVVIGFPTAHQVGLDRLIYRKRYADNAGHDTASAEAA